MATVLPMAPTQSAALGELRAALEPLANAEQAFTMAGYVRDQFTYLGIKAPPRRVAQQDVELSMASQPIDDIVAFCHECWAQDEREFQYVACDLLRRVAKRLEPEHLDEVKKLIITKSWWDTVDALASRTVGSVVQQHGRGDVMDEWIEDDHLWVARTALLHQLFWRADTDDARLFEYCKKQMGHQDFFIRKAIGWALRDYGRTDADAVLAFVKQHEHELSPLSRREALKHIG